MWYLSFLNRFRVKTKKNGHALKLRNLLQSQCVTFEGKGVAVDQLRPQKMLLEHLVHFENIIEVWGLFVEMEGWKGAMVRPRPGHKTLLPPLYGASTYISEATTLKYQLRPSRERGKDL